MTEKELLYTLDAYEHEQNTIEILNSMLDSITNDEVISFVNDEINKHTTIKKSLKKLLEDKKDE